MKNTILLALTTIVLFGSLTLADETTENKEGTKLNSETFGSIQLGVC